MEPLDNPPDNPCWGCGPTHPRGLRLGFARDRAADGADEVVVRHVPQPDEIGWPGLLHTGLHFAVLYEVSYWAAWELGGHVANSTGEAVFEQPRLPRVGQPFVARARIAERTAGGLRMLAQSATEEGKPLATLRTAWRFPTQAEVAKWNLALPGYITRDLAP